MQFDAAARRYQTRFTTLAVNCESCHGPGRRHVELARSGKIGDQADIGMRPLATLTKDQSLRVCFQCHAVKTPLEPGYLPGRSLDEHFALKLPALLDSVYFADGRTRAFAYQEGHLSSDCYLNGSMTCVDCHDPHTQHYRDVNRSPLPGRLDNGQCLGCHPSKAEPLERHTHHRAASPGSRCVSCHMPYLQQSDVGRQIPYARSDHTIPIPRPLYDARLGVDGACRQCHRQETPEGLQAQVTRWYGELKPHPDPITATIAADSVAEPVAAARRVLAAHETHPLGEFVGLTNLLRRYAFPDAPEFDREVTAGLERRATSRDPEVRALALATLHLARGATFRERQFLSDRLQELAPRDAAVRDRWAWILEADGDRYLNAGDYRSALAAYQRADEVKPNDASIIRGLGVAYTRLGELDKAADRFRRSLELNPNQPQVLVELGVALAQGGDLAGAITAFQSAVAVGPWDPIGYANLGAALLQRGAIQPAVDALEKAVSLDPSLADASFTLARAYATLGRLKQATGALERSLEFAPGEPAARQMLDEMRSKATPSGR